MTWCCIKRYNHSQRIVYVQPQRVPLLHHGRGGLTSQGFPCQANASISVLFTKPIRRGDSSRKSSHKVLNSVGKAFPYMYACKRVDLGKATPCKQALSNASTRLWRTDLRRVTSGSEPRLPG
jgi:hypothetical protein